MKKTNFSALGTLTIVFFFWGFIAAGNSVFIPFCKSYFNLDQFQSQLVDFAFYGAYYLGALFLFILGSISGKDFVGNWGYKKSIVFGLLFSALGAIAMIFAVYGNTFSGMLIGLFIMALGFSLQQTAAQPFAISLGDPSTGSTRVNFTGGVNSFGTMIGPLIVALALFGSSSALTDEMISKLDLIKVIILYGVVGFLFIAAAAIFGFSKAVPSGKIEGKFESSSKALRSLVIMSGILILVFIPVFSSYSSKEAKTITKLDKQLKYCNKQIDSLKTNFKSKEIAKSAEEKKSLFQELQDNKLAQAVIDRDNELLAVDLTEAQKFAIIEEYNNKVRDLVTETAEFNKSLDEQTLADKQEKINATNKINSEIKGIETKIKQLKHPLDKSRMLWLFAAFIVVIMSLLITNLSAKSNPVGWGAMRYPQLVLGMIAIFIYVGVEVSIGSNLGELLKKEQFGGMKASEIAPFISMYWGSLMIGRWTGAISAFNLRSNIKMILTFVVPLLAFGIILLTNSIANQDVSKLYFYIVCVLVQIIAFYFVGDRPAKSLLVFGSLGLVAMIIGMISTGNIAIYAFLSGGLFCSILWPCIFTLSITGLGKYTSQGSAFLIMMILGGGIIPPIQGKLADLIGIQASYFIAVLCFAYLAAFAILVERALKKQGITDFSSSGNAH